MRERIEKLLEGVREGTLSIAQAMEALRDLPYDDLGFARIDHHRELRTGVPEIVWGENKSLDQLRAVIRRMSEKEGLILATRVDAIKGEALIREFPEARYHPAARLFCWPRSRKIATGRGRIAVLAAGTSDLPVAEEAAITAELLGNEISRHYDVGVAGLHRLLAELPAIRSASVAIVIAGLEGALPSVVAGLIGRPIVAVPTSVGYGTGLGGIAALLSMLNSCAPGISVVNIDNGVGAAVTAHLINSPVS